MLPATGLPFLQLVTEEAETIKAQIGSDVWLRQRVWEQKRDAYFKILKSCRVLKETLSHYVELRRTNFLFSREHDYSNEFAQKQRDVEWNVGSDFLKQIHEVKKNSTRHLFS